MSRDRTYFLLRKLHSLTGIVPVGVFLLAHLAINSSALLGECYFTDGVRTINALPYLPYIEFFGIVVPIAFHGLYGLWMAIVQARYNPASYNYSRNWWYLIQRLTGVALLVFLGWHLWDMPVAKLMGQMELEGFHGHLSDNMSTSRFFLSMFVIGVLGASFHFTNGLWGFCASWGILQSRSAQRLASKAFALAGVVLFAAWLNIVYHFASGGAALIPVQEPPVECTAAELDLADG